MTLIRHDLWAPPTVDKRGYPGIGRTRLLSQIKYFVAHSAEGWRGNIMPIQNDPNREASWPMTVLLDGTKWMHYQVEDICWINGNPTANIEGFGVEFEGVKGTPITDAQVKAGAEIYTDLKAICPNLGPPILGQGFEEHRRVSGGATTCPNDRIRWSDIRALVTAPLPKEENDMFIITETDGLKRVYVVGGCGRKRYVGGPAELGVFVHIAKLPSYNVTSAQAAAIPDELQPGNVTVAGSVVAAELKKKDWR